MFSYFAPDETARDERSLTTVDARTVDDARDNLA
jgi:hypothetical protein